MNTRWTRLLTIWLTALLLLAAAGPAAQPARATEDEPPQEVLAAEWSWISSNQGSLAGSAAAGAGDVNGDGYADVIVGAPLFSTEIYRSGAAFLFYGSAPTIGSSPTWIMGGEVQGKLFGQTAAGAGDVNCDGYDDVIVGAPAYGNNNGKVYVYHGSPRGLSMSANWTYTGPTRDIYLGWSAAAAGDVNGDGCDDIIVGAKFFSEGQDREGAAFVFHGSPDGLSATPDWRAQINQAGAQFGFSVSGAGDLNRDGYADVIVGAPYFRDKETTEGALFVYYGSADGLNPTPGWAVSGGMKDAKLGWSVTGAGDVNGDGYPDLAAGAPGWEDKLGAVFAYYGSSSGPNHTADWSHFGENTFTGYGEAVAGVGDLNGDGFGDLLVSASRASNDQREEGIIYVYHGGPQGLAEFPGWRAEGNKSYTGFGASLGAAGDVNQDGFGDIIVGAPEFKDAAENNRGGAFVYHGFYQEVVDGEIVPIDPGIPIEPAIPGFSIYLPVMTY